MVVLLLSRPVVRQGVPPAVVPVRLRWADVHRWVAVPVSPFPVPAVVRHVLVVPAVVRVAVLVAPVAVPVGVARRANITAD